MHKRFNFLIILLVTLVSCKQNTAVEQQESLDSGLNTELPDGFHDFYDRFHSDTIFQLNRIVFPLKGQLTKRDSMETLTLEKIYQEEGWKLHKPFNADAGYSRGFTVMGDLVLEKIEDNMGLFSIERRWGKVDSTWSLIYYGTEERSW